jgi:hypothetical protein
VAAAAMTPSLRTAAARGDVAEVRRFAAAGADVDEQRGEHGGRPLHYAAHKGQVAVVELLVELGADKDATNAHGRTPLHVAAKHGQVAVMTALLQLGADKDAEDAHGKRPLHWAAENGELEVVSALVQRGAQLVGRTADGASALQLSIHHGHHQVALCLAKGLIEQARAAEAQPAGVEEAAAAVEAAAAAVEEAEEAERQQVELELVALTARSQQLRARLRGTTRVTPAPPPPFNHGAEGAPEGACTAVRGVPGRSLGPHPRAVRPPARVHVVCGQGGQHGVQEGKGARCATPADATAEAFVV